jgi:hypothetical protein
MLPLHSPPAASPCSTRSNTSATYGDADLAIGRQQPHPDRRRAHRQHRQHHHGLAPVAIADVPAQQPADRTRDEADSEAAERRDRAGQRIAADRKEQLAEQQRGGRPVQEEVVPFECLPEHGGHDRASDRTRGAGSGQRNL